MKKIFVKLFASLALLGLMSVPLGAPAQPGPAPQAGQKAPRGERAERGKRRERHPEIRAALRSLARAKEHLQNAAHDFGGHRAEALEAVNKAIEQLRLALKYDKE